MVERIGILTGGGDCPGLNAVIRAVVKAATLRGWETIGFLDGFDGMLDPPQFMVLNTQDLDGLLFRGGTILGTRNKGRFSAKTGHGEVRRVAEEILAQAKRNFDQLGLRCLIVVGGDGSLTIAQQLFERGVPVIGIPKTIDNDIDATLMTFGFESAVTCAVEALDRLHTTAQSHDRVMVLEVMGRYAGWIALYAGIAGGADVILIPEMPFNYENICAKVEERERKGKEFTIVIVAEGAFEQGKTYVTEDEQDLEREAHLGGIGDQVSIEIEKRTGKETRCVVLGHLQRGGMPTPFDRQLCTRFGVSAVEMVMQGKYGCMVALKPEGIRPVTILEAIGKLRTVPPEGEMVQTAKALGTSFGTNL